MSNFPGRNDNCMKPQFSDYFESGPQSLVMRLWQSGRELFHSNVLAFLLEHGEYGAKLLAALTGIDGWRDFHVRVLREKNNIDLIVIALPKIDNADDPTILDYWENVVEPRDKREWRLIAIENKFKSLPDESQLEEYNQKIATYLRCELAALVEASQGIDLPANTPVAIKVDVPLKKNNCPKKIGLRPADGEEVREHLAPILKLILDWWDECEGGNPTTSVTSEKKNRLKSNKPILCLPGKVWRVLLQPTSGAENVTIQGWRVQAYDQLVQLLDINQLPRDGTQNNVQFLEQQFLEEYKKLIASACKFHCDLQKDLIGNKIFFSAIDKYRAQSTRYRLRDFVDKWRYRFLEERIREQAGKSSAFCPNKFVQQATSKSLKRMPGNIGQWKWNETGCWIFTYTSFSRSTGMAGISLYSYRDDGCHPFTVDLQLQANRLKLMIGKAENVDTWEKDAMSIFTRLACHFDNIDWKVGVNGEKKVGTYVQRICVLKNHNNIERNDGSLRYIYADMWGNYPTVGTWSEKTLADIAVEIVNAAFKIASALCTDDKWKIGNTHNKSLSA